MVLDQGVHRPQKEEMLVIDVVRTVLVGVECVQVGLKGHVLRELFVTLAVTAAAVAEVLVEHLFTLRQTFGNVVQIA